MPTPDFMQLAIDACLRGIALGQAPFGACIVRGDEIVATTHNRVWLDTDITAHAEIGAIRDACRKLHAIKLTDCDIYSTTEPCPMCFSAIHWAGMRRIYYGCTIADAQASGFSELTISNQQMKTSGGSTVEIIGPMRRQACRELFDAWLRRADRKGY